MPTVNLTQIAIILAKSSILVLLFAVLTSFMGEFSNIISNLLQKVFNNVTTIGTINIGYVAGAIGLSDFLNLLFASIYTAGSLYISGMVSIIIFKYSIKVYQTITNF